MENSTGCRVEENGSESCERLRFPNPKRARGSNNLKLRILAFSSFCLVLIVFAYVLLLITHLVLIACWAKLYNDIDTSLPRTFAWEVIIQFFGSTYHNCKDHSGKTTPLKMMNDSCKSYHSPPAVPILAMSLLVSLCLTAIFYPVEKYIFSSSSNFAFKSMILSTILTVMFTLRNIVMHCVYFGSSSSFKAEFEHLMKKDMTPFQDQPLHISTKWLLTQETGLCCGVDNFTDWKFHIFQNDINPRYPQSCCDKMKSTCHIYPSRNEIHQNGCLSSELDLVYKYAGTALGLTLISLITSILFVFLLHIMDTLLLSQEGPIQGSVKMHFSMHSTATLPTSVSSPVKQSKPKLSLRLSTIAKKCRDMKSREMDLNSHQGTGDHKGVTTSLQEDDDVSLIAEPQVLTSTATQEAHRNKYSVKRESTLHICINLWGITWRSQSSSVAQTHVLKKETLV